MTLSGGAFLIRLGPAFSHQPLWDGEQRVQHAEHGLQRDAVWNTDLCGSPSSWSSSLGMLSSCRWICVSVWLGCGMVASARHRRHDHECRTSPGTTQPSGGPSVTLSLLRSSSLDGQSQTQHKFLTQTHPISPPKGSMQPDALFQLFGCIHSDSSCLGWEGTVLRKSHQHR